MQEDQFTIVFARLQAEIIDVFQALIQLRQFVVMGGEQGAAADGIMQVFGACPGDGQAVPGRGATADFIENDKGALGCLGQDGCGFDHLHHEGRTALGQVVASADTRKQAINDTQMHGLGRHEQAGLGHDDQQGVLAQVGRFTGHVWAGDKGQAGVVGSLCVQIDVVRRKGLALRFQCGTDHRVAAAGDFQAGRVIDLRADGVEFFRPAGICTGDVERADGVVGGLDGGGVAAYLFAQAFKQVEFQGQALRRRTLDAAIEIDQFSGDKTNLTGQALAVDELFLCVLGDQLISQFLGQFDKIAQDVVELDADGDAGLRCQALFQGQDDLPAVVAQGAHFVQFGIEA